MAVKITIDDKEYEVDEKLNLLQACESVGIEIPHFCFHPGLGPDGNCRMCQVEIETPRGSQLVISCNTAVTEGMVVKTSTERVRTVRAAVEEFLLLNHPLDCPICDKAGECMLQNYYMAHDRMDSFQEFERQRKRKALILGKTLVLDQERCILCERCVRFLRDIAGSEELYIAGRGNKAYLTNFPGKEVTSPYSLNTVDLCPVGALTSRDFRFASPVWFLRETPSVCTSCSRGCSIEIDHKVGKIFRLRPRYNPYVNAYWMCDEGRLNYKFVNENRLGACEVAGTDGKLQVTYDEALRRAASLLGCSGDSESKRNTVLLASALCTLEEMFMLKHLSRTCLESAPVYVVLHVPEGVEDELLRKSDRHPNAKGAELLSLEIADLRDGAPEGGLDEIRKALGEGGIILAAGFDYGVSSKLGDLFSHASGLIALASRKEPFADSADVVFASMTFAEKEGTIVNFQGHAQALHPANVGNNYVPEGFDLDPPGVSQWRSLSDLAELLKPGSGFGSMSEVRKAISREEKAFSGVDLDSLGESGVTIATKSA